MPKVNKQILGKGAAYVYFEIIASMVLGYIFWIIISKISTTNIIGTLSTMVTFAGIISFVAILGVNDGNQRFLGRSFSEHKLREAKVYVEASLVLVSIGVITCTLLVLFASDWISNFLHIDISLILIAVVLMGSSAIYTVFYSVITASLRTKVLPLIIIFTSIVKLLLAIGLFASGYGILGLAIGYTFGQFLACIILAVVTVRMLRSSWLPVDNYSKIVFRQAFKNIYIASVASWIPFLIMKVGSDLGTIVIFGYQGADQAAIYFIAFAIVTAIMAIIISLSTISLPALSSMDDGRKKFAWKVIRLSTVLTVPFALSLIFYSKEVLQLIGSSYVSGSVSFQILLTSMVPVAIVTGISTLLYAKGDYRRFLIIGLVTNVPRTILYFLLSPILGITGAALSYTIGSFLGLIPSIVVANRIGMLMFWKDILITVIVPLAIGFVLYYFQVGYIAGIVLTNLISYIVLLKLGIIVQKDLADLIGILPHTISNPILSLLNKLAQRLGRSK